MPDLSPLETAAWSPDPAPGDYEIKSALSDFLSAFEQFKQANDRRLDEIEKKLSADIVTRDQVDRLNGALDEQKSALDRLVLDARRPALGAPERGDGPHDPHAYEHKSAWDGYMRKGDAHALHAYEAKSLTTLSDPDGGYLVPRETERTIDRVLSDVSPIRAIAGVRQIGSSSFRKPMSLAGTESGWVAETEARPRTEAPSLSMLDFPAMELYAMPSATQGLLDDAYVDVEAWLAEEVQSEFAEQEGRAFVSGDGVGRPRGFLSYDKVAEADWSWGKVGFVATGAPGAFAAEDPSDALLDLLYTPKQAYRQNGTWVMNRKTQASVRKLKDKDGNYLWSPGLAAGQPASLLGYPVREAEDMPDIEADAYAIAYGDFRRGYLVVDRVGIRTLRDPYSAKPFVLFYTTKRVGGGIQNFEALKLLKFAA